MLVRGSFYAGLEKCLYNTAGDIKKIMKEDKHNLVYPQWVLDCVKKKEILPLRAKYVSTIY